MQLSVAHMPQLLTSWFSKAEGLISKATHRTFYQQPHFLSPQFITFTKDPDDD